MTSAPPPEPPHDPRTWGYEPAPTPEQAAALRAAAFTWIVGGVTALMFTCFGTMFFVISVMPFDALVQQMQQGQMPPDQLDQIREMRPMFPLIGVAIWLFFVVPALALVILGFSVKRRNAAGMLTTQIVLGILAGVLGLITLMSLVQNAAMGNILGALCPMIMLGGVVALSVYTLLQIQAAKGDVVSARPRRASNRTLYDTDDEPWNRHLR